MMCLGCIAVLFGVVLLMNKIKLVHLSALNSVLHSPKRLVLHSRLHILHTFPF